MTVYSSRFCILMTVLAVPAIPCVAHGQSTVKNESRVAIEPTPSCARDFQPIVDALMAPAIGAQLVGREVAAQDVRVERVAKRGFWVSAEHKPGVMLVVPAEGGLITVRPGELVSLLGEVRALGVERDAHDDTTKSVDATAYVYAYTVRPAW